MEYRPRYAQPFTLDEARQLAVPIITEEITRLQNSLVHLQRTQEELQEALSTTPDDSDLTQAFEENEVVVGSQKERITILQMVLAEKGILMSAHYDVPQNSSELDPQDRHPGTVTHAARADQTESGPIATNGTDSNRHTEEAGVGGVYL